MLQRRGCSPRGAAGPFAALVLLLAARPACARLVVEAGPPHLRGAELLAAPFAFTPAAFDVRARVVLTRSDEWNDGPCPPVYVGSQSLDGAIVLRHRPSISHCSYESNARGAGAAGAVGWLIYSAAAETSLDPLPGWRYYHFWPGDSRSLPHPPAADVTHRGARPLVDALLAGQEVHARFTRSETVWVTVRLSPAWVVRDVLLVLQSLVLIELIANRLYAFWRADGGLSPGIAQAVLQLELGAQLVALVLHLAQSRRLPVPVWQLLIVASISIGVVAGTLFLLYWAQAAWPSAEVDGVRFASPTLAHSPRARRRLLAFVAAIALLDVGLGACYFFPAPDGFVYLQLFTASVLLPLFVLVLSLHTHWRARKVLPSLPPGVVRSLTRSMACTNAASAVALLASAGIAATQGHPWFQLVATFVFPCALNASSAVHASTFAPLGVKLVPGPLERCARVLLAAAARLCSFAWRAVRRLCRCVANATKAGEARLSVYSVTSTERTEASASAQGTPPRRSLFSTRSHRIVPASSNAGAAAVQQPEAPELEEERPHLLLGVQLGYLRELRSELHVPPGVASYQVGILAKRLSMSAPARHALGFNGPAGPCSVAELVRDRRTADGCPAVARANLFVSHAQVCPFDEMLSAFELYARIHDLKPTDTYLWIDVLCMRQGASRQEVRHIGDIVRATGRIVLVLQPWAAPVCLTRSWCLFEVLIAALENLPMGIALPTAELRAAVAALATDRASFDSALTGFDVRASVSSREEDRRIIFEMLEDLFGDAEAGADEFNCKTHAALRKALAGFSWSAAV